MKSFNKFFNDVEDIDYDPIQLQIGIEIEKEHTNNLNIAKIIAKHHLAEDPKYYTKIKALDL